MKMKIIDVKTNTYIEFGFKNSDKDLKFIKLAIIHDNENMNVLAIGYSLN